MESSSKTKELPTEAKNIIVFFRKVLSFQLINNSSIIFVYLCHNQIAFVLLMPKIREQSMRQVGKQKPTCYHHLCSKVIQLSYHACRLLSLHTISLDDTSTTFPQDKSLNILTLQTAFYVVIGVRNCSTYLTVLRKKGFSKCHLNTNVIVSSITLGKIEISLFLLLLLTGNAKLY